ncbi:hypothetical protein UFOVP1357_43 [uncultured Caudovirales phage]|uniref:DUF7695 domain-containing protein n=1 Tax=uncultured Caudovirales phage TaxID=2100421 RepID=A0A6J5L0U0_9CAUD|nr:hypothetical protein UFOVP18_29 [uncultured Caudovirales phage]CAB4126877.1 hypothetical protein UFOVP82_31 [uncultured Caudovirales phage]CAB4132464.1 hypothetical protein UFOVP258_22 [uncultured Caudovirales phage]CAB4146353.1 hypothetical protein UFOVP502_14 [uncultured Caudovirales phage]CAB4200388.1 hypothetical protein UFOVP1357_43 [uncultured Caudovirales phage]
MRNRAKCKICSDIIESLSDKDHVSCKCDQISVFGGESMLCQAKDWTNFIRIDDRGVEIIPTIINPTPKSKPTRKELIQMLDDMIESIEKLPDQAMIVSVNQYDFYSLLVLLASLFKAETVSTTNSEGGSV